MRGLLRVHSLLLDQLGLHRLELAFANGNHSVNDLLLGKGLCAFAGWGDDLGVRDVRLTAHAQHSAVCLGDDAVLLSLALPLPFPLGEVLRGLLVDLLEVVLAGGDHLRQPLSGISRLAKALVGLRPGESSPRYKVFVRDLCRKVILAEIPVGLRPRLVQKTICLVGICRDRDEGGNGTAIATNPGTFQQRAGRRFIAPIGILLREQEYGVVLLLPGEAKEYPVRRRLLEDDPRGLRRGLPVDAYCVINRGPEAADNGGADLLLDDGDLVLRVLLHPRPPEVSREAVEVALRNLGREPGCNLLPDAPKFRCGITRRAVEVGIVELGPSLAQIVVCPLGKQKLGGVLLHALTV